MFDLSPNALADYASQVVHQKLVWPALDRKNITVYLRRDDQASVHYSGNKFYKLFFNIKAVFDERLQTVVSFGGAYSNHIHALASMGKQYGLATVGIIRGHQPKVLSPTLQDAQALGMELLFLNKHDYKHKDMTTLKPQLDACYGSYYVLPEGGENLHGVLGCQAIGKAIDQHFDQAVTVCCAVGTGATFAGIVSGVSNKHRCMGFSVLKGEENLSAGVGQWLQQVACDHPHWQINADFHHGGYAKTTPALLDFMQQLERDNDLLLEPVYSAKMLWGIEQLALQDFWPSGSQLVAVHGGGLQGRRGFSLS